MSINVNTNYSTAAAGYIRNQTGAAKSEKATARSNQDTYVPSSASETKETTETAAVTSGRDKSEQTIAKEAIFAQMREGLILPGNFLGPGAVGTRKDGVKLSQELGDAFSDYYRGNIDQQTLENKMTAIVEDMRSAYVSRGFDEAEFMPQLLEDVYNSARQLSIRGAFEGSWYKGAALAAEQNGHTDHTRDWIYYDADFYYSSEAMKVSLQDFTIQLGEKYGVSPDQLELPTDYPEGDVRASLYTSYNTYITHKARNGSAVGNMLDETMVPPEGFKFFYKGGKSLLMDKLEPPQDEPEAAFDGVLQVWYGDWSFTGRVPVRMDPNRFPISVNMFDVINNADPGGAPSEIVDFLANFDFHTSYWNRQYNREHPRKF